MNWKNLLPLILGIIISIVFGIFAIKAMDAGDHSPSGVFYNEYNSSGVLESVSL